MDKVICVLIFITFAAHSHAVRITEDFNSTYQYDGANSTGTWAVGYAIAPPAGLDLGTGADGDCNFSGNVAGQVWNCLTLSMSNVTVTGPNALHIKVKGSAFVNGTIDVNGASGSIGYAGTVVNAGATGRAGGGAGGQAGNRDGAAGATGGAGTGPGGGGSGHGLGGCIDTQFGGNGGGGGANNATYAGTIGALGVSWPGDGAFIGTAGAAGTSANTATSLTGTLFGGAGGGGGGMGDNPCNIFFTGGSGGAGGGAVQITAGGTINVSGGIAANGGNGGGCSTAGAGGGGGSGGSIFLQADQVNITGTLSASAGSGAVCANLGGNGGDGGHGLIRFDESVLGAGTKAGSVFPTAATNTLNYATAGPYTVTSKGYDTRGITNQFKSSSYSAYQASGDTITVEFDESSDGTTWASAWTTDITTLSERYIRFRVTIDNTNAADPSKVYAVNMYYDILEKSEYVFEGEIACGTIGLLGSDDDDDFNGGLFSMYLFNFFFGILLMFLAALVSRFLSDLRFRNTRV
jgi:hypothetical protein